MTLLSPDLLHRLQRVALLARRSFRGAGAGERRARTAGASIDFRDHRLYSPGDDLRHLDWNLLARLDRLYVKRFHDQQDVTLHLVVDASASMRFGEPSKIDAARRLAAALAFLALGRQDRARIHALGERGQTVSTADFVGRRDLDRLVRRLESVEAAGGVMLDDALAEVARSIRRPGIVVVVSDFLAEGADRSLTRLAAGRHQLHVVLMLSRQDVEPDADERLFRDMRLRDAESGDALPVTLSPVLRSAYRDALGSHEAEVAAACRRARASFSRVISDEPTDDVVLSHLRIAGLVG